MTRAVVLDARVVTGAGGGPDKTILNTPRLLEPQGYRMLCVYLRPPNDPGFAVLRQKAQEQAATLIEVDDRGPWDWRVVPKLLSLCRQHQVAIWHGHDYKSNALGLILTLFHPMRLVSTVHGWVRQTARTPLYYRIDRYCLRKYERVFCVSEDLITACRAAGIASDRLTLLENGIDARAFRRSRSPLEARIQLGLPPQGLLIGAVGRLSAEKGFDHLLHAAAKLVEQGRDGRVLIVGEGEERERLQALAAERGLKDRVFFPGWVADVRPYYEAMDVFVLSSLREGLPNVLLEAMAMEVPVVATRVNGVPQVIQDRQNGRLVEPQNADALASAIAELADNLWLRERFRQMGRIAVETLFSFETRIHKLKAAYDELLGLSK